MLYKSVPQVEVQTCIIPHLKALKRGNFSVAVTRVWQLIICYSPLKITILLHKLAIVHKNPGVNICPFAPRYLREGFRKIDGFGE